jgi:drug/metabolite transporter (DMT)-like permease
MTAARDKLVAVRERLGRPGPLLAAALVFGVSWVWASRGADQDPLWPSVPWPDELPPLLIAVVLAVATLLIAHLSRDARRRVVRGGARWGAWLLAVGVTGALLSWSVEALLRQPRAGEWLALAVGLLLACLVIGSLWREPR